MKRLVVLSGAGISADSGLSTFRDNDGLWEKHSVYDVATPEAWHKNPALVLEFYNQRRKQLATAQPNPAHVALKKLEDFFDVHIITQNVDDLHERAGSTQILHLHGELTKARSTKKPSLVYEIEGWQLSLADTCELGSQLRPHIVWFGEEVPFMPKAAEIVNKADILIVVGTSLNVYPAASLVYEATRDCKLFVVDPKPVAAGTKATYIMKTAAEGMPELADLLIREYTSPQ
jgi:NAD-dependent deacetylase